jgi:integrase
MPGFHADRPPRNKGLRYPADPPTVEEIVAVMRIAGDGLHGRRLRGLLVVLWRAGLRIDEALALREADLNRRRGSLLVRHGKGGRRREVGMDDWGWQELEPWLAAPSSCRSVRCSASSTDAPAAAHGPPAERAPSFDVPPVEPECADASLRINCATRTRSRWPAKAWPLIVIQRQLGHSNLGITSVYLQGIDNAEIIETVHARRAPMIPASASLRS